jgi:hypothetical protein
MQQTAVTLESAPLSQGKRVLDTFVAPTKTFIDIRRNTSWWLPFLLLVLTTLLSGFAVDRTVGFTAVAEHEMTKSPAAAEQLQQMPPDRKAQRLHVGAIATRVSTYAASVFALIFMLIEALVLWASFNFGLGAQTTFSQMLAVIMYSALPRMLLGILNAIFLFSGVNTENFDLRNPVGTNLGYYLTDAPKWLKTAGGFFDVLSLWSLVLLILGTAIISRKTKGQAAIIVVGWWVLILIVAVSIAAVTG